MAVLFFATQSARADFILKATLSGSNQVPADSSLGTGTATLTFLTASQTIMYDVVYSGLSTSALEAHIHFGPAGANGPIILPFMPSPSGTSGELMGMLSAANLINQGSSGINTFSDIANAGLAGKLYVNIDDANYPSGEIRGQLASVPEPSSVALVGMGVIGIVRFAARNRIRKA